MTNRKDRQLLVINRDEQTGEVSVIRTLVPSTPQTLVLRLRKGQQVVVEIEPDNTKMPRAKS